MKIPNSAPRVHVWEKRRPNKETVRIEVSLSDFLPAFKIRVGWRPFRGRYFRFPGDDYRHRKTEDEENAAVFAIVTQAEIAEAIGEFAEKIVTVRIPDPVTPPRLRE